MTTAIAEIIDPATGEVSAPRPTTLSRVSSPRDLARVLSLESMSDEDFETRLTLLKRGQTRMRRLIADGLLVLDEDYGEIPGTSRGVPGEKSYKPGKNTLLKAGAEKLLKFFGLAPSFELTRTLGDGVTSPTIHVMALCLVHIGDASGEVIGSGQGTANTWEVKHRYRKTMRACPGCGAQVLRTSKFPPKGSPTNEPGGFWCPRDKNGCGAEFHHDDPSVLNQDVGESENRDPYDLDNTVVKMARKRSLVDAALLVTATSGLFTQDMEADDTAQVQVAREAHAKAVQSTEDAVRPLLDRLKDIRDVGALDAELLAIKPLAEALPEATRAVLKRRCANMREALVKMAAMDTEARAAMQREPDPEPIAEAPEQAAQRAELAAALREPGDDGPPPDEEQAMALVEPCRLARSTKTLATLWERVKATTTYQAATPGAQLLAEATVSAMRQGLLDEQRAAQKGGAA